MPGADREAEGSGEDKAGGQERRWLWRHDPEVGVQDMSLLCCQPVPCAGLWGLPGGLCCA